MKKRYLIVPLVALCITSNVYAITSNEVTYDNEGTTENLTTTLDNLYSELKRYKTGGSVQSNQMLEGATGYSKGELVTGTIKSKASQTYTPGTSNQTIAAGQYLSGDQIIQGDANLTAANIAAGKSIFGVSGTYTSDATATAAAILSGKTAYVNGAKVTGTIGSVAAKTYTPGTSNQTIAAGQYLSGTQTIAGDTDLKATNILSGVNIFGVNGTHTAQSHQAGVGVNNHYWCAAGSPCTIDYSYTFQKDGIAYVFVGVSSHSGGINSNWSTLSVTVGGTAMNPYTKYIQDGGWNGHAFWVLNVSAGQTVVAKSVLQDCGDIMSTSMFMAMVE